jgi:hypothetical protein
MSGLTVTAQSMALRERDELLLAHPVCPERPHWSQYKILEVLHSRHLTFTRCPGGPPPTFVFSIDYDVEINQNVLHEFRFP